LVSLDFHHSLIAEMRQKENQIKVRVDTSDK